MEECTYSGIKEIFLNEEEMSLFYNKETKNEFINSYKDKLIINQYLVFKDENGEYLDRFRFDGNKIVHFKVKEVNTIYTTNDIKPRNIKQHCCFDLLQNDNIPIKLITGSMGSGKTFLTFLHSLNKIECDKNLDKIVYVRNNVDVKDVPSIGALPSGIKEKLLPYILPLGDIIGGNYGLELLEKDSKLEYLHLGFARGRNFTKTIVIVSESENLTREHVALLIGRIGENSCIIFEGDTTQVDKKVFSDRSGIQALKEVLKGNPLFGCVHMDKSERSKVAELSSLF